ncbi:helix-turn-helix domain-containing protein [Nocardioides speluncae]|uniref:helix-turn-helix domain-containing protein n=1 Tax=Nocardioides speluncae TaxID=2670337 RepID=UPI000D6879C8|nr:hypothetical protein [Nocardioides speluncae]
MNFAEGLRAAIAVSGLSLEELAERLTERGRKVSTSSLSAWQSGLSRPVRAASLLAVTDLEEILGVAPCSLASLLPERATQRRRVSGGDDGPEKWVHPDVTTRLLSRLGAVYDDPSEPERLTRHLRAHIGPDGCHLRLSVAGLVRGRQQTATRLIFMSDYGQLHQVPSVVHSHGVSLNRFRADPSSGLAAYEFLLDRPLEPGEVAAVSFTIAYPARFLSDFLSIRVRPGCRDVVLDVHFDERRPPVHCWAYHTPDPNSPERVLHEVTGDAIGTSYQLARLDPASGMYGIRWELSPARPVQPR